MRFQKSHFFRTSYFGGAEAAGIFLFLTALALVVRRKWIWLTFTVVTLYFTHMLPFVVLIMILGIYVFLMALELPPKQKWTVLGAMTTLGLIAYFLIFRNEIAILENFSRFKSILSHLSLKNFLVFSWKDILWVVPIFASTGILAMIIFARSEFWEKKCKFRLAYWLALIFLSLLFMYARTLHLSVYRLFVYAAILLYLDFSLLKFTFKSQIAVAAALVLISVIPTYTIGLDRILLVGASPSLKEWKAIDWAVNNGYLSQESQGDWAMDSIQKRLLDLSLHRRNLYVHSSSITRLRPDRNQRLGDQDLRERFSNAELSNSELSNGELSNGELSNGELSSMAFFSKRQKTTMFFETIFPGSTHLESIDIFEGKDFYADSPKHEVIFDNDDTKIYAEKKSNKKVIVHEVPWGPKALFVASKTCAALPICPVRHCPHHWVRRFLAVLAKVWNDFASTCDPRRVCNSIALSNFDFAPLGTLRNPGVRESYPKWC